MTTPLPAVNRWSSYGATPSRSTSTTSQTMSMPAGPPQYVNGPAHRHQVDGPHVHANGPHLDAQSCSFHEALRHLQLLYDMRVHELEAEVKALAASAHEHHLPATRHSTCSGRGVVAACAAVCAAASAGATHAADGDGEAKAAEDAAPKEPAANAAALGMEESTSRAEEETEPEPDASSPRDRSMDFLLLSSARGIVDENAAKISKKLQVAASVFRAAPCDRLATGRAWGGCIDWDKLDFVVGMFIIANAVTIGFDTDYRLKGLPIPLGIKICEYVFLAVYVFELGLRLTYLRCAAFKSMWVRFDAILVICGLLDVIFALTSDGKVDWFEKIMIVRLLRLIRIARVFRVVVQFRTLWILVRGLVQSLYTLFWTFILICSFVYVFAIFGVEMIQPDESASEEYNDIVSSNFGTLGASCLTLIQGLTLDSIGSVYRPLVLAKPYLLCYFVVFILLVSIALMNLVTAILVESTIQSSQDDRMMQDAIQDARKKTFLMELHALFKALDADGSKTLSLQELEEAPQQIKEHVMNIVGIEDISFIFHTLDFDEDGSVGIDEFCEGILATLEGKPIELIHIIQQCHSLLAQSNEVISLLRRGGGGAASARLPTMATTATTSPPASLRRPSKQLHAARCDASLEPDEEFAI
eukprot:TRINITY_DN5919_c1_g1_i2.p1 TRINITY_DN5919_c1_g1~~TRINITY_DN5919_c1_g1_i2.p1  ORF type:complete len:659 (-),score=157.42 TRINITY_DN5919_c1_g1_i2:131-2059(-)